MRVRGGRGSFTFAAVLPATLLAGVLVAAPFAGTTTAPLASGGVSSHDSGAADVPAADPPAQAGEDQAADGTSAEADAPLRMPLSALHALVAWYVAIALAGLVLTVVVAVRMARRRE